MLFYANCFKLSLWYRFLFAFGARKLCLRLLIVKFTHLNLHISIICFKFAKSKFKFTNLQMDIISRLKQFLQQNGIAISQFADNCQIPRPTLSQLLNGRNKKVSDEVIAKIHHSYPSLNIMWLMFGDGDMFVPNANMLDIPSAQLDESGANALDLDLRSKNSTQPRQSSISFDDDEQQSGSAQSSRQTPRGFAQDSAVSDMVRTLQTVMSGGSSATQPRHTKGDKRRVVNIIVYYNDQSFEIFGPNN